MAGTTAPSSPLTAAQEWQASWGIVAAGIMGMALLSIPAVTLGLFIEPLEREFNWTRAEISLGMTIFALITTPLAPFAGALADRFGSRRIAVPGSLLNALALAAFGLVTGYYWHFVLAWVIYSFTQLLIRTTVWNRAASASFMVSRGLALAVMMGGIPLAQTIAPIAAQWLIGDYGWRNAYFSFGVGWGGLTFLVAFLLFRESGDRTGTARDAQPGTAAPPALGLSFGEALRDLRILRIAFAITLQSAIATALSVHIFPLLTETGLSREAAAGIVALLGVAALVGQLVTGVLADRVTSTLLPVSCFILPAAAILTLQGGGGIIVLAGSVALLGYSFSATVAITTYLTSRYGGVAHFGKIFGIISSCMGLGSGIGPWLAGRIFDQTGSYDLFLTGCATLAVVNAFLVFRLGKYPEFTPKG